MTIETKFNVGDEVLYLMNNEVTKDQVLKINITVEQTGEVKKEYYCNKYPRVELSEKRLFATKQELIESL